MTEDVRIWLKRKQATAFSPSTYAAPHGFFDFAIWQELKRQHGLHKSAGNEWSTHTLREVSAYIYTVVVDRCLFGSTHSLPMGVNTVPVADTDLKLICRADKLCGLRAAAYVVDARGCKPSTMVCQQLYFSRRSAFAIGYGSQQAKVDRMRLRGREARRSESTIGLTRPLLSLSPSCPMGQVAINKIT